MARPGDEVFALMRELVSYAVPEPGIALITIDRADKMNALNEDVIQGLRRAWQRFADGDERVAVLAAAGDRAFSVGADIKDAPREMWQGVPSIGVKVHKPVIAAVHGWCIGGAYVIVQMCDLVVAAENTVFKYPEAQVGFTGGLIASAVAQISRSPGGFYRRTDRKRCCAPAAQDRDGIHAARPGSDRATRV
jgi:enoyl-CoA hydratase